MSYNGSGTFSVLSSFTTQTTISSSAMNALLADIASGLSNAICKDGQSTVTGQIKAASGTVALPGLTFGSDTDCGLYRIGADNIGFSVGGVLAFDVDSNSINIASAFTLAAQAITAAGAIGGADGTVSAPGLSFSGDTNTGLYRIGADNIGITCNGAKVVDIGTSGAAITGTLSATGAITKNGVAVEAFASGTVMLFQQTSAPTGWTKSSSHNDRALRVTTGTVGTGGTTVFTSVFADRTITQGNLPSVSLSSASLSVATTVNLGSSEILRGPLSSKNSPNTGSDPVLSTVGVNSGGISPSATSTVSGSVPLGGSGTAMNFNVAYVDVIIATKD